ncbi:hypothetical protein [Acetobacter musti]|uniref:hypothetical protein n=1 Tax=Acetobacter musti TaxID=864732 RepID=UPI0018E98B73
MKSKLHTVRHGVGRSIAGYGQRYRGAPLFGKPRDWRRIATRYERCAHTFFSAICLAATVIFWMP